MAEALVSKVLEQLASITLQQTEEEIKLVEGVDEEVGKLASHFQDIQAVLVDAEKRQVKEATVREWLDRLKDIAYDVDDVLDEWSTTIQKLRIMKVEVAPKPSRMVRSLLPHCLCFHRQFVPRYDIAVKIRHLHRRLDIITMEKDRFHFSSITKGSGEREPRMTTSIIDINHMMTLGTLLEEDSWSMFSKIAFFGRTNEECEILKEIGKKLVQKCKGEPLAIKILASLLCFKTKIEEWQDVLDSEIWKIEEVKQGLFPPLLLSYYDLPSILKRCFLYCAIFPKDYKINKNELIKLWMAQDYLKAENNKDVELVGEEYFKILTMRSLFQHFEKDQFGGIISFKMHDIVHKFAQFLTRNECFKVEEYDYREFEYEPSYKKFRHAMRRVRRDGSFSSSIYAQKFLHTLVVVVEYRKIPPIFRPMVEYGSKFISYERNSLSKLFDQLTCLRTLSLAHVDSRKIPKQINKLIHLRYLNLSESFYLKVLPETLCELYNLQILNISGCREIKKLPQGIGKLINLRCLENTGTRLSYLPKSFEKLTGLRRLDKFVISDVAYSSKACSVECLKIFNHLQEIGIEGLGNLTGVGKAKEVELYNKKNLRVLNLGFGGRNKDIYEVGVLEALQPPTNLEKLKIEDAGPCALSPDWIISLTNLRELSIKRCYRCEHLYGLGKLSSLEYLEIGGNKGIKRLGNEFLGAGSDATSSSSSLIIFPKLKFLWFWYMDEWEEWKYEIEKIREDEITIMPSLQTLKIVGCPKLKSLPNHLRRMTTLKMEIEDCPLLKEEIERSDRPSSSAAAADR